MNSNDPRSSIHLLTHGRGRLALPSLIVRQTVLILHAVCFDRSSGDFLAE